MAKYTDPNTGVKYSTHTGLKVFTVIVVILLVISIVLNVVLYTQSSEKSELDSDESGELDSGYGEGDNGEGGESSGASSEGEDGENLDGALPEDGDGTPSESESDYESEGDEDEEEPDDGHDFPELEEDDEDNVIVTMEGGTCMRTGGFDENGVATGVYYYPSHNWEDWLGNAWYGCVYCGCECLGHDVYITKSGGIYEYIYPLIYEQEVEQEVEPADGSSVDIGSKISVSLIFGQGRSGVTVEEGSRYSQYPDSLLISSLTGEPLQIESVEVKQYVYYSDGYEYHSESGLDRECSLGDKSTDLTHIYSYGGQAGSFTVCITMTDGGVYTFEYWVMYEEGLTVKDVD